LAFCAALFAQTNENSSCPKVTVDGPSGTVKPGETVTFTATVEPTSPDKKLIYNWTVDAGEIIEGQGTSTITIKPPSKLDWSLTTIVEIKGLPEGCPNGESETLYVDSAPEAVKIDEFGTATNGNVKMRFDNFIIELQNDPTAQGYIINYGSAKEIANRQRQIRNAIAFRKFDASRITIVNGGESGESIKTQFWVVPAGATPPTPGESESQDQSEINSACPKITVDGPASVKVLKPQSKKSTKLLSKNQQEVNNSSIRIRT
jgi:hypothetical protein